MHFHKQFLLELPNCTLHCSAVCVYTAFCFPATYQPIFMTLLTAGPRLPDTDQTLKKSDSLQRFSPQAAFCTREQLQSGKLEQEFETGSVLG